MPLKFKKKKDAPFRILTDVSVNILEYFIYHTYEVLVGKYIYLILTHLVNIYTRDIYLLITDRNFYLN